VVDDYEPFLGSLCLLLKRHYPNIFPVNSFSAARERIREEAFSLVLSDIDLGDGSGIDLIDHVKGLPEPPKLLFITGRPDYAQDPRLKHQTVLLKPISAEALLDIIGQTLSDQPDAPKPPQPEVNC